MKQKYFYSHIVATADISLALGNMDMPSEDRIKLIALAEENLHHAVIEAILSQLSEEDKKHFLLHLSRNDHEKVWILLKDKLNDAEGIVMRISKEIKDEMHRDIKSSKND